MAEKLDDRVGVLATPESVAVAPRLTLDGRPCPRPAFTMRSIGRGFYVVLDGVPKVFDAEAAIAEVRATLPPQASAQSVSSEGRSPAGALPRAGVAAKVVTAAKEETAGNG